jgi:hypothetical protein
MDKTSANWTVEPRRMRRPEDIEQLLRWAYAQQRVDRVLGCWDREIEIEGEEASTSSLGWGDGLALLGCRVQTSSVSVPASVHADAAAIHEAVLRLDEPVALLVMEHARRRTRPEWDMVPTFRWRRNRRGLPLVEYAPEDTARNYGWCPIDWTTDLQQIETARGVYQVWRRAIFEIGAALVVDGRLRDHAPTGPLAPYRPWQRAAPLRRAA